jgi:hypothetical protein
MLRRGDNRCSIGDCDHQAPTPHSIFPGGFRTPALSAARYLLDRPGIRNPAHSTQHTPCRPAHLGRWSATRAEAEEARSTADVGLEGRRSFRGADRTVGQASFCWLDIRARTRPSSITAPCRETGACPPRRTGCRLDHGRFLSAKCRPIQGRNEICIALQEFSPLAACLAL